MKKEEAIIIFNSWQDYMDIAEKFECLMLTPPESFLPYPANTLLEALTIISKDFINSGNKKMAEAVQGTIDGYLSPYFSKRTEGLTIDEEAIRGMKQTLDLMEQSPELKKALLRKLKECQDRWIKSQSQANDFSEK